jgi:Pro-kumamolisin, activation domain
MANDEHRILAHSELKPAAGARALGNADPDETLKVTLCLRHRPDHPAPPDHAHWVATPPLRRKFLSPEQFAAKHGALPADLDAVTRFARAAGLEVVATSVPGRTVVLSGSAGKFGRTFGVELKRYESDFGAYRGYEGPIRVPNEIADAVTAVFGLDNRRLSQGFNNGGDPSGAAQTNPTPVTVAQLYNFPTPADATGQIIGVIEFSGALLPAGWSQPDIDNTLLDQFGLPKSTTPVDVPVTGTNNAGIRSDRDGEVILDICVAAAAAPGATIRVYWGADQTSPSDWVAVLSHILGESAANLPHAVTNSWVLSSGDDLISQSQANEVSAKFRDLAAIGVTVFSACGDDGARAGLHDGAQHVQYPGSDPWLTSCGGTTISTIPSFVEWVWNDFNPNNTAQPQATGGGVSAVFTGSLPPWQQVVSVPVSKRDNTTIGRGVPDVAGNASVVSGYPIVVDKVLQTLCGTSAVAPLYAGLIALITKQLGARVGFLNPTLYAFRDTVCRDVNALLLPGSPQDNSVPAWTDELGNDYPAVAGYRCGPGWDACTGLGVIDGGALLAALQGVYAPDCQFILDRTQFGQAEVAAALAVATPALIDNAFYVIIDGFSAPQLGITAADLSGTPSVAPTFTSSQQSGVTVVATSLVAEDVSLPATTPQRFTWICAAKFPDTSAFASAPTTVTFGASTTATTGHTVSDSATVALVVEADPYEDDGPISWLSEDLRVFQVSGTNPSLPAVPSVTLQDSGDPTTDAPEFITSLVGAFNADTTPPPNHPFDSISTDETVSQVTVAPVDQNMKPVYNFAVARVRYQSTVSSDLARVFFRIFQASTTSTAYNTSTYAVTPTPTPGNKNTKKIPLFGVDGAGNVVAVPCFAAKRVTGVTLDNQADPLNATTINAGAGGVTVYSYFGCWLDINQSTPNAVPNTAVPVDYLGPVTSGQSVLGWIGSNHNCLVAEISYDDDPVQAGQTPASSDKLAQRNLCIVPAANPGVAGSRRIPQSFDLRPTAAQLPKGAKVDELMIDFGELPRASKAAIFLPGIDAAEVLELAAEMYPSTRLTPADAHTLLCPAEGAAFIPIPRGGSTNFVGLLTVDLAPGVRKGEAYTIVARQITTYATDLDAPQRGADANARAPGFQRRILGSFQITVPVATKEELLAPAEQLLAIMRWVTQGKPPGDRWTPVLDRFLKELAERVEGFGGEPSKIAPSPIGFVPQPGPPVAVSYTGKVKALRYDRFGDFDGFILETLRGREIKIPTREPPVERLAERAWRERILVTAHVAAHEHDRLVSLTLIGPPGE